MKVKIGNILIDNLTMVEAVKKIESLIQLGEPSYVVTPNVDHLIRLQKDKFFFQIYEKANLILADGMPLLWAAKFFSTPLKEKISGSDLFPELCKMSAEKNYRLFFIGGRPNAALITSNKMREKYNGIKIVGTYSPPFGFEKSEYENKKIRDLIIKSKPDILFVGLGSPKQEIWIKNHSNELKVPVSIGIGVTFEFFSGMVRRAPKWMQKCGLEWLWRLMMEPRRLWVRYVVDDMPFLKLVLEQKFKRTSNYTDLK